MSCRIIFSESRPCPVGSIGETRVSFLAKNLRMWRTLVRLAASFLVQRSKIASLFFGFLRNLQNFYAESDTQWPQDLQLGTVDVENTKRYRSKFYLAGKLTRLRNSPRSLYFLLVGVAAELND